MTSEMVDIISKIPYGKENAIKISGGEMRNAIDVARHEGLVILEDDKLRVFRPVEPEEVAEWLEAEISLFGACIEDIELSIDDALDMIGQLQWDASVMRRRASIIGHAFKEWQKMRQGENPF